MLSFNKQMTYIVDDYGNQLMIITQSCSTTNAHYYFYTGDELATQINTESEWH